MTVRAAFAFVLAFSLLSGAGAAQTPSAQGLHKVGLLCATLCGPSVLAQKLQALGWVEGTTIVYIRREANGDQRLLDQLARELVDARVDVIVPVARTEFLAAQKATKTIPIVVISLGGDLVAEGFVKSLARPGGNITGSMANVPDMYQKQWELLREMKPGLSALAVLLDAKAQIDVARVEPFAQSLGLRLIPLAVHDVEDLEALFKEARRQHANGLYIVQSGLLYAHRRRIAELALEYRLPSLAQFSEWADAGVLLTYWTNREDLLRRAAVYVDKVLRGANPGDLPIERPTQFELVVNRRTARALGLEIPPSFQFRIDRTID